MRRRFFVEQFTGDAAVLAGEGAHHLGRVLRAAPGQVYELSDGRQVRLARVERVGRDAVHFALLDPVPARDSRLQVSLLLAVVKFDRFEWALEKATELGAGRIVPLAAARSERALVAAAAKRAARWRKILLESAQQARCLRPPELDPVRAPREAFRAATGDVRVMLSERPGAPRLREALAPGRTPEGAPQPEPYRVCLAVGPEGGWTDEEFAAAQAAGFTEVSLGDRVLRTETAVIAALAAVHLALDD